MSGYRKHIIIVGSARSGTSWLVETMAKQHRYRLLFEPDHPIQTKHGHLICDQWIENREEAGEAHGYLKKVFANKVDSDWIAQNSNRKWKRHLWPFIPLKFIIKFIRTNLMAGYLNSEYGIPVIHILRNPYDVLASQQRVRFPWLYDLSIFQQQAKLVEYVKKTYGFDIVTTGSFSELEILTLRWCLENMIPLKKSYEKSDTYTLVKHEDLRADIELFRKLCISHNLQPIDDLESKYTKPSSKTHPKSEILQKTKQVGHFTAEEYRAINTILKAFAMNMYPLKHKE